MPSSAEEATPGKASLRRARRVGLFERYSPRAEAETEHRRASAGPPQWRISLPQGALS